MIISSVNIHTPKQLLEKFKKGERPEYQIENQDKMSKELDVLAQKYKQNMTIENKAKLLRKERSILYDEIINPEWTLARNYKEICDLIPKEFYPKEVEDTLRLFNITGLYRMEAISGAYKEYKQPIKKEHIEILKKAYSLMSEKTTSGQKGRELVLMTLNQLENKKTYSLIQKTYKDLLKITRNRDLRESLYGKIQDYEIIPQKTTLRVKPDDKKYLRNLINDSSGEDKEIKKYINKVLKNKNIKPDVMRTAVLGAGKFKSDENFEIVKQIALNINEPDIRKREFALHSTALYMREKPEEVKKILEQVISENSKFTPLGKILLDKVTGNYYCQKDRELKYAGLSKKEIAQFKKFFNTFYKSEVPLSPKLENICQMNIFPFRKQFKAFKAEKLKYFLQFDTYTKLCPQSVAKRTFYTDCGIFNSGDYNDCFDGINTDKYNMMNLHRVASRSGADIIAHENGHSFNRIFTKKEQEALNQLYEKALKENRTLNYYAATNSMEYFAEGCRAMTTVYRSSHDLLRSSLAHTRYELMVKDPGLYKFIKKCLKKCH